MCTNFGAFIKNFAILLVCHCTISYCGTGKMIAIDFLIVDGEVLTEVSLLLNIKRHTNQ